MANIETKREALCASVNAAPDWVVMLLTLFYSKRSLLESEHVVSLRQAMDERMRKFRKGE